MDIISAIFYILIAFYCIIWITEEISAKKIEIEFEKVQKEFEEFRTYFHTIQYGCCTEFPKARSNDYRILFLLYKGIEVNNLYTEVPKSMKRYVRWFNERIHDNENLKELLSEYYNAVQVKSLSKRLDEEYESDKLQNKTT